MMKTLIKILIFSIFIAGCMRNENPEPHPCDSIPESEFYYYSKDSSGWIHILTPIDSCGYFRFYAIEWPDLPSENWEEWMRWAMRKQDSIYLQYL